MLDDDQDMADMYLGRRQEIDNKPAESLRQELEPPSPSHSAESMDDLEPSDFMGQIDTESETEAPRQPRRNTSFWDVHLNNKTTPSKQAHPPPQVNPSPTPLPSAAVSHSADIRELLLPLAPLEGLLFSKV